MIFVKWFTFDCLLTTEKFNTIEEAQQYIKNIVAPALEANDKIELEEME